MNQGANDIDEYDGAGRDVEGNHQDGDTGPAGGAREQIQAQALAQWGRLSREAAVAAREEEERPTLRMGAIGMSKTRTKRAALEEYHDRGDPWPDTRD